jgi:hypothetical protein
LDIAGAALDQIANSRFSKIVHSLRPRPRETRSRRWLLAGPSPKVGHRCGYLAARMRWANSFCTMKNNLDFI